MHHEQDIRKMGGLKKHLPITHITFLAGCLAITGIPPFAGFFSKDEILLSAVAKHPVVYGFAIIGAFMTAFYMYRLYALTFLGKFRGTHEQEHHLHESPLAMTIPLIVLAVLSLVGGWVDIPEVFIPNGTVLKDFLAPIFEKSTALQATHEISHSTELILMGLATIFIVIVGIVTIKKYSKYDSTTEPSTGLTRLLENKWYVDEIYEAIVSKPVNVFGKLMGKLDKYGIDWVVNGVGRSVQYASRQVRLLQSGQVGSLSPAAPSTKCSPLHFIAAGMNTRKRAASGIRGSMNR